MISSKNNNIEEREELYIDTAEAEHVEMYLKAIWSISERKEEVKVSSIAKLPKYKSTISCTNASQAKCCSSS